MTDNNEQDTGKCCPGGSSESCCPPPREELEGDSCCTVPQKEQQGDSCCAPVIPGDKCICSSFKGLVFVIVLIAAIAVCMHSFFEKSDAKATDGNETSGVAVPGTEVEYP